MKITDYPIEPLRGATITLVAMALQLDMMQAELGRRRLIDQMTIRDLYRIEAELGSVAKLLDPS